MSDDRPARPRYPPLTLRHKRIFAVAAVVAVAITAGLALWRLSLIRWWLGHCGKQSEACTWAEFGYEWGWGVALLAGLGIIALVAHRLTADRLLLDKP